MNTGRYRYSAEEILDGNTFLSNPRSGTLTMEAWRLKMEAWRVYRIVVADSHHFDEELDPDPH